MASEKHENKPRPNPPRGRRNRMGAGEKPENFKETWKKLLIYCKNYWVAIILSLIFSSVGTILALIGPDLLSNLTDLIQEGLVTSIDLNAIRRIGLFLVFFYSLSTILNILQGYIMGTITQKISEELRADISEKINDLPMAYFAKTTTGDILSRVTNDVDTIGQSLNQSISSLVTSGTMLIGSLVMMLITNITLTITAVLSTLIGVVLMQLIMSRSRKYFISQQKDLGDINSHVEEIYTGHTIVKAYNGENSAKEDFRSINNRLRDSNFKSQALSGMMMPIMQFIGNFGYVAVCVIGAVLVTNDQISIGVIVAFIMYVRFFTQPMSQIAQSFQTLQSAAASGERVFEFLEAEELSNEEDKTENLENIDGNVTFDHVQFGYSPENILINDFSVEAKAGQKIAIVGPTGAGKTTVINLLMRFYDVLKGDILIDGVPTKELKRENVREQFGMVLQDTWLFEGTIRENLVYNLKDVSEEEIKEACEAVGIAHFIRTLPEGLDTVLSDQSSLSSGQKQQLTIARAMIANKPMLILDEATSSVDTRTELHIQNAMDQLMVGRTSFVIAHRLSTIRDADLILVMNHGDIIEKGNHKDLLALDGFYSDLYNSQFEQ